MTAKMTQIGLLLALSYKAKDQTNAGNWDSPEIGGSWPSIAGDTFTGGGMPGKPVSLSKALFILGIRRSPPHAPVYSCSTALSSCDIITAQKEEVGNIFGNKNKFF